MSGVDPVAVTWARQKLEWDSHVVAVRRTARIHGITPAEVEQRLGAAAAADPVIARAMESAG